MEASRAPRKYYVEISSNHVKHGSVTGLFHLNLSNWYRRLYSQKSASIQPSQSTQDFSLNLCSWLCSQLCGLPYGFVQAATGCRQLCAHFVFVKTIGQPRVRRHRKEHELRQQLGQRGAQRRLNRGLELPRDVFARIMS